MKLSNDSTRVAAHVPLDAIQFTEEEMSLVQTKLQNTHQLRKRNQVTKGSLPKTRVMDPNETEPQPTIIYNNQPHDSRQLPNSRYVNVNGVIYDTEHVLHVDELERMGYRV